MRETAQKLDTRTIVFFDGVCNLCNGAVNWLIDRDTHHRLYFAPLQGETFAVLQEGTNITPDDLSTIVLWSEGRFTTHSEAVLRTCSALGGVWRLAGVGLVIPAFLRDGAYRFIARHRYQWFGTTDACRVPTTELAKKFLH